MLPDENENDNTNKNKKQKFIEQCSLLWKL